MRGLELEDGRRVVVKARPAETRLRSCFDIQLHAWRSGLPCPQPLVAPQYLGGRAASAEAYVPGGSGMPESPQRPALFAQALHRLVETCASFSGAFDLAPAPPWVGWGHPEERLWPPPDNRDADLNRSGEPAWLDDLAWRVRRRLQRDDGPPVIGHCDLYQPNVRWLDGRLHCIDDWDSLVYLSEAAIAGATACIFSTDGEGTTPIAEGEAFLDAYAAARGSDWTRDELDVCWAAGLWVLAFNAKKESLGGPTPTLTDLRDDYAERLRRAGC